MRASEKPHTHTKDDIPSEGQRRDPIRNCTLCLFKAPKTDRSHLVCPHSFENLIIASPLFLLLSVTHCNGGSFRVKVTVRCTVCVRSLSVMNLFPDDTLGDRRPHGPWSRVVPRVFRAGAADVFRSRGRVTWVARRAHSGNEHRALRPRRHERIANDSR